MFSEQAPKRCQHERGEGTFRTASVLSGTLEKTQKWHEHLFFGTPEKPERQAFIETGGFPGPHSESLSHNHGRSVRQKGAQKLIPLRQNVQPLECIKSLVLSERTCPGRQGRSETPPRRRFGRNDVEQASQLFIRKSRVREKRLEGFADSLRRDFRKKCVHRKSPDKRMTAPKPFQMKRENRALLLLVPGGAKLAHPFLRLGDDS